MKYLLFYEDDPDESRPFGDTGWWVKKFCGWFGIHPVPIDDLAELVNDERFHGHAWLWLDPHADHYLSWTATPREDIVFVVGHDMHGFYGFEGEGMRAKLPSMHPDGVDEEYHAAISATLLLCRLYL